MKERGMIFNAEMVLAILEGRKTQTRRLLKQAAGPSLSVDIAVDSPGVAELSWLYGDGPGHEVNERIKLVHCPYGKPGDRIWVRETWADVNHEGYPAVAYRADGEVRDLHEDDGDEQDPNLEKYWFANWYPDLISGTEGNWTPSIHMPRWASRILLEITDVRVEKLASVSDEDAGKEGYPADPSPYGGGTDKWLWFRQLWDGIYPEQSFKHNPWVWVIEFKVVPNVQDNTA